MCRYFHYIGEKVKIVHNVQQDGTVIPLFPPACS
jgi:hypothetical protein